jgi:DNA-directed RNA polymerase subunit beta'
MIVREEDCGTDKYLVITKEEVEEKRSTLFEEAFGRVLAEDLVDVNGKVLLKKGEMIRKKDKKLFDEHDIEYVKVRSPLTCNTQSGVCQKCYGMDL